jgi:uncharacterized protein (TIGR02145 family)
MNFIKRLGRTLLSAAIVVIGAVCLSYGDNPSEFVGRWGVVGGSMEVLSTSVIELFKDGTGILNANTITWKVENNRFIMFKASGEAVASNYSVSNYELILTDVAGEDVAIYLRDFVPPDFRSFSGFENEFLFAREFEKLTDIEKALNTPLAYRAIFSVPPNNAYYTYEKKDDGSAFRAKANVDMGIFKKNDYFATTWKSDLGYFVHTTNNDIVRNMKIHFFEVNKKNAMEGEQRTAQKKKEEEQRKQALEKASQKFDKISTYFTDSRDGQKYRAVTIGGKTWMAKNLNYQTGTSWCYGNNSSNCDQSGRLYDWNTAKTACPSGWHLPSRQEWNDLVKAAGSDDKSLAKAVGISALLKSSEGGWEGSRGLDKYGFSALAGGLRDENGRFGYTGKSGYWWSDAEYNKTYAYAKVMSYHIDYIKESDFPKNLGLSVRCVQN